jgi:hypothetical protein
MSFSTTAYGVVVATPTSNVTSNYIPSINNSFAISLLNFT